jgi:hypothetical protein
MEKINKQNKKYNKEWFTRYDLRYLSKNLF